MARFHPLPNVGREAHAWLHHLFERYHTLSAQTVFAQGRPFDHAPDFHRVVRRLARGEEVPSDFWWLGFLWETDDARGFPSFVHWTKNPSRRELNLADFFPILFGESAPAVVRYVGAVNLPFRSPRFNDVPGLFTRKPGTLASPFPMPPTPLSGLGTGFFWPLHWMPVSLALRAFVF